MRSRAATVMGSDLRISDPVPKFFRALCESIDTPASLATYLMFQHGEHEQLAAAKCNPRDYCPGYTKAAFKYDYLAKSVLKKYKGLKTDVDLEGVAYQKWVAAESQCHLTNRRFRERWSGVNYFSHSVEEVLHLARRKMRDLLLSFDDDFVRTHCHFGKGADVDTRGSNVSLYHKFASDGALSPGCISFVESIFSNEESDCRGDFAHLARVERASRLSFVPKTALTHRAICVEPRWNVYTQLGIGELIADRLRRRAGIDIRDQTRNQGLSRRAMKDGLATIDLSSASDSVSINLVIDLLAECEPRWLDSLLLTRTTHTTYRGKEIRLEKISSMGNGYTFPLETLIFYSIAQAAMKVSGDGRKIRQECSVYGDDIVVPQSTAPLLIEALNCFGFSVNSDKSYTDGAFFESCGTDWFHETDVRPFFIKENVTTVPQAIVLCNQIAQYARDDAGDFFATKWLWNLREHIIGKIPSRYRFYGPPEAGGSVIHASFDVSRPRRPYRKDMAGWEGYVVFGLIPKAVGYRGYSYRGHLLSKLSNDLDSRNSYNRRNSIEWSIREVHVPTYTDVMLI